MEKSAAKLVSSAILILAGVAGIAAASIAPTSVHARIAGLNPVELLGILLVVGGAVVYIAALIESKRS